MTNPLLGGSIHANILIRDPSMDPKLWPKSVAPDFGPFYCPPKNPFRPTCYRAPGLSENVKKFLYYQDNALRPIDYESTRRLIGLSKPKNFSSAV